MLPYFLPSFCIIATITIRWTILKCQFCCNLTLNRTTCTTAWGWLCHDDRYYRAASGSCQRVVFSKAKYRWKINYSPTVRSTATHNIWLLAVKYRLISRFIFSLKNPLKHALIWVVTACLQEFVDPEDDFFMGTISLKDLVSIPMLKLNILLHIYDRKLCARPNAWMFWHEQVPCPPLNSNHNGLVDVIGECLLWSTYPRLVVVYD